jgi:hypothetical protein
MIYEAAKTLDVKNDTISAIVLACGEEGWLSVCAKGETGLCEVGSQQ